MKVYFEAHLGVSHRIYAITALSIGMTTAASRQTLESDSLQQLGILHESDSPLQLSTLQQLDYAQEQGCGGISVEKSSGETISAEPNSRIETPCIKPKEAHSHNEQDDVFCNECLGVLKDALNPSISQQGGKKCNGENKGDKPSNYELLISYFEVLNGNYQIYDWTAKGEYSKAIDCVLGTPIQDTLLTTVFDLTFGTIYEMERFFKPLQEYACSEQFHCRKSVENFLSLFKMAFNVSRWNQNQQTVTIKNNGHAIYYRDHKGFLLKMGSEAKILKYIDQFCVYANKNSRKRNSLSWMQNSDAKLRKIFNSAQMTDQILIKTIEVFTKKVCECLSVKAIEFIANYRTMRGDYNEIIQKYLERVFLNQVKIARGSICNFFRMYRFCHRLPLHVFLRFNVTIFDMIQKMRKESNDKDNFIMLQRNLFSILYGTYYANQLNAEHLQHIQKYEGMLPHLAAEISEMKRGYFGLLAQRADACSLILQIAFSLCKYEDFGLLRYFLHGTSTFLSNDGVVCILYDITNNECCEIGTKVCILYEMVNCNLLTEVTYAFIMEKSGGDRRLLVAYLLALLSYIKPSYKGNQGLTYKLCDFYIDLYQRHFDIFNHDENMPGHSQDYYLLHAYDISLKYHLPAFNFDSKWREDVKQRYRIGFYVQLWGFINPRAAVSRKNPCYKDLDEIKVLVSSAIRYFTDVGNDFGHSSRSVSSLFLPDMQI